MNIESSAPTKLSAVPEMEIEIKERILIVDDELNIRNILLKQLGSLGFDCHTVDDGLKALQKLKDNSYDLVLMDIKMPRMNGIEALKKVKTADRDMPVVMISSLGYVDMVRKALRGGAYDYLVKPWDFEELKLATMRALEHGRLLTENSGYQRNLERKVEERTKKLEDALKEIRRTYHETILALGSALETRDIETQAHSLRVSHYSFLLAKELGVEDIDHLTDIERGAYLHDIGKIGVPDQILRKPDSLTDEEWHVMKRHPEIGKKMIEGIEFLKGAIKIVYYHHEHYDGSGYPQGLMGEHIPIEARIFSVADAFDALLSDRPYRKALSISEAKEIILCASGRQFDTEVVKAFEKIAEQVLDIAGEQGGRKNGKVYLYQ